MHLVGVVERQLIWADDHPLSATCLEVAHWMNSQAAPFFSEAAFMARAQIQMLESKLVAFGACSGGAKAIFARCRLPRNIVPEAEHI